jgi:hypothetical protein
MDLNRQIVNKLLLEEERDTGHVQADMAELLSMMWEITRDAWSFIKDQDAEQRLQRDVTTLIRRAG